MFSKDTDKDTVILLGARASRVENQDAIDACIVGMLADPKEVTKKGRVSYNLKNKHFAYSQEATSTLNTLS